MSCPRCGSEWKEIGPDGGVCPKDGFIPRAQVDQPRTQVKESGSTKPEPAENVAVVQRLADVQREEVEWLWEKRIPRGKITVLDGDPEVGKSYLSVAIATAVTLGVALPDDRGVTSPSGVLILTAEDGLGDTVRPRAEEMGADLTRIFCLTAVATTDGKTKYFSLAEDLPALEAYLQSCPISLVIIDPVNAYLGSYIDTNKDSALRSVLTPLATLAEKYKVAVLVIRHLTKGNRDKAIYRGQGSIAYVAAARSVLLVGKNPQDESERAIICIKNNLAEHPPAVSFEINEGQFRWKGTSSLAAEDLLQPESGERRSAVDVAVAFLREALKDGSRPMKELEKEAESHGITPASLNRARGKLGVSSVRIGEAGKQGGGVWLWSLPSAPNPGLEAQTGLEAQDDHLKNLSFLTRSESGEDPSSEEVDLLNPAGEPVLCRECAGVIPAGSDLCTPCRAKQSSLVTKALELGATLIVPEEERQLELAPDSV